MEDRSLYRITDIVLDEQTIVRRGPEVEHERQIAIHDLLEQSYFRPEGSPGGPYHLHLSVTSNRLTFDIRLEDETPHFQVILSLAPFRRIVRDYFVICDSYYEAIKKASPSQIEAIDMGRRAVHNEGSDLLRDRLEGKIEMDQETARRLFTLICVLHIRG